MSTSSTISAVIQRYLYGFRWIPGAKPDFTAIREELGNMAREAGLPGSEILVTGDVNKISIHAHEPSGVLCAFTNKRGGTRWQLLGDTKCPSCRLSVFHSKDRGTLHCKLCAVKVEWSEEGNLVEWKPEGLDGLEHMRSMSDPEHIAQVLSTRSVGRNRKGKSNRYYQGKKGGRWK